MSNTPYPNAAPNPREISPVPPLTLIKYAGHHWLDNYDWDGRYHGTYVFQWSPASRKWCKSGDLATGSEFLLPGWVYNSPCPEPPILDGMYQRPPVDNYGHRFQESVTHG